MSALTKPGPDLSVYTAIESRWKEASDSLLKGSNIDREVREIEKIITDAQNDLKNKLLRPEFDWEYDIDRAVRYHSAMKDWTAGVAKQLQRYSERWHKAAEELQTFAIHLAHSGLKSALLAHGAVGIAAFSALNNTSFRGAAIVAIIGAIIGTAALTLAWALMMNVAAEASNDTRNELLDDFTYQTNERLGDIYDKKVAPKMKLVDVLIYGSIGSLPVYATIALIVVLHSLY